MNGVIPRVCGPFLWMLFMACGPERVDVGAIGGGIDPFAAMNGVFLGMSQEELRRARPNIEVVGYAGFREVIEGDTVIYRMPGSVNDNDPPPKRSRLESVGVTFVESGDSAAEDRFDRTVAQAQRGIDATPTCARFVEPDGTALEARWILPSGSLIVRKLIPAARADFAQMDVARVTVSVARTRGAIASDAVPCSQATELPAGVRP